MTCGNTPHENASPYPHKDKLPHCINCGGNHLPTDTVYPDITMQKAIIHAAADKNISLMEARRKVRGINFSYLSAISSPKLDVSTFPPLKTLESFWNKSSDFAFQNKYFLLNSLFDGNTSSHFHRANAPGQITISSPSYHGIAVANLRKYR
ncbi:hypothetical protein ALC56_03898 [Trachymyrmex septentrionalis]|uniref:Uncharacterized protein n=1 Tax=Trachymyrmex septentrionalis TaxID=34720 RepID=A0A151JZ04_9HYME|nr:hypothetical protein ALC56_03898 [Trachymyrmex septentrionalis]